MLLWAYLDASNKKVKMQRDYDNYLAWLSGFYVRNAVGAVLGGEEYPEALDFTEMERWESLTEEERNKELQKEAIENTMTQMERVRSALKFNKKKDGD